jgi:hypothetical protein
MQYTSTFFSMQVLPQGHWDRQYYPDGFRPIEYPASGNHPGAGGLFFEQAIVVAVAVAVAVVIV